jgi:hypothetical protein
MEAIDCRGLSGLVTIDSYADFIDRIRQDIDNPQRKFDPLISMIMTFQISIIKDCGFQMLLPRGNNDDGMPLNGRHYCALCVIRHDFSLHNTESGRCVDPECSIKLEPGEAPWDARWISRVADDMFTHASKIGLITVN